MLPSRKVTFKSALTPEQVVEKLNAVVKPCNKYEFWTKYIYTQKPFRGMVNDKSFTINRVTSNRYQLRTMIKGLIKTTPTGTSVSIDISYNTAQQWFITVLFFLFLSVGAIAFLFGAYWLAFIWTILILAQVMVFYTSFGNYAKRSIEDLRQALFFS